MLTIAPAHLKSIRITTGIIATICSVAVLINNIVVYKSIFNIMATTLFLSISVYTLFSQKRFVCYLQVALYITVSIIAIYLGEEFAFVGILVLISGILLAYVYRIIKSTYYMFIIPATVLIIGGKLVLDIINNQPITREELVIDGFAILFIVFILFMLKDDLDHYISESHKNDSLIRIGLNAGNFVHNLHLATIIKLVKAAQRELDEGDIEEVRHDLKSMNEWAMERKKLRDYIVSAVDCNQKTEKERINVNETINSVINTLCFNQETILNVTITTKFATTDVFMQAVPYEVYFILQNIMCNAVEAMLKMGRRGNERHKLFIQTSFGYHEMIVAVRDTGPGFPVKDGKIVLKSSKPNGGFGIRYINAIIRNYGGYAEFMNNPDMGATVRIHFKKYESKLNICFKDVEKKEEVEDIL